MIRISVTIKTNARQERVDVIGPQELKVAVNAPPIEGRANERLIEILAEHFGVPKSRVTIRAGLSSRRKRVEIL